MVVYVGKIVQKTPKVLLSPFITFKNVSTGIITSNGATQLHRKSNDLSFSQR